MVAEYRRYQDCYATVKKAWTVIEEYLDKNNILLNNVSLNGNHVYLTVKGNL